MSPRRTLLLALLVVLAGCTGAGLPGGGGDSATTTEATTTDTTDTTEPHTARGTSHAGSHLSVRSLFGAGNLTVTLAPDGDAASFEVDEGAERSFAREIHDRGHDVRVVVERGDQVVFDQVVRDYQSYRLTVGENETTVTQTEV